MKNIVLSTVAVLAMSSFAVAGGDVAPIEEPMVEVVPAVDDAGFYLGLAYGWQAVELYDDNNEAATGVDANFGSIMLNAGYKFNPYIAVEGRYWFGLSSSNTLGWRSDVPSDITVDSWGIYVKPMYPVTEAFDIYALLGYAGTDLTIDLPANAEITTDSANTFSWGIGAAYDFNENISMFVDYTQIANNEDIDTATNEVLDVSLDTVNIGVNYKF